MLEVELQAFNKADAADAVVEALEDIDALGARVTKLDLDSVEDLG